MDKNLHSCREFVTIFFETLMSFVERARYILNDLKLFQRQLCGIFSLLLVKFNVVFRLLPLEIFSFFFDDQLVEVQSFGNHPENVDVVDKTMENELDLPITLARVYQKVDE